MLLLVQAGETVVVVSPEESDWWRGEVDGRTGVFPSNYVQPAPCEYGSSGSSVLRIRNRDPGCLFDPWIRNPGWVKCHDPDPVSGAFLTPGSGIRDG
jgi:hypothetical protein